MRIDARFNGPPTSAHGGVACGVFAAAIDARSATVRLSRPPPLDEDLAVVDEDDGSRSIVGSAGVVATVSAWPGEELPPLPRLTAAQLDQGRTRYLAVVERDGHPFPTCYGCGHQRADGDGLELFPGAIPGTDVRGAAWVPAGDVTGEPVEPWMVWAAVDCPSGMAVVPLLEPESIMLLGEMSLHLSAFPEVGNEYQVVARPLERVGRRLQSVVGLLDGDGAHLAHGRATWIAVDR